MVNFPLPYESISFTSNHQPIFQHLDRGMLPEISNDYHNSEYSSDLTKINRFLSSLSSLKLFKFVRSNTLVKMSRFFNINIITW